MPEPRYFLLAIGHTAPNGVVNNVSFSWCQPDGTFINFANVIRVMRKENRLDARIDNVALQFLMEVSKADFDVWVAPDPADKQ